jgi:transcriptional regulator with XRE-family HTH domain
LAVDIGSLVARVSEREVGAVNRLREYRERYGWTQAEVVAEIHRRAVKRGDPVMPGLDQAALSKHEHGHKRPGPRNRALYCDLFGVDAAELGFRVALPGENGEHEDVDRREFLTGAAGFIASASLATPAPTRRLDSGDLVRLRQSLTQLYALNEQHGEGAVYGPTARVFYRLRELVEHASYDPATGRALRELAGQTARRMGSLEFHAGRQDDARRWWLEALHWARLAESDLVSAGTMASMSRQASDQHRPREAIDLATAAQRTVGRAATPRLVSTLLAREALGHAGAGDATSARAALRRARGLADKTRHDDDPRWLDYYGIADFTSYEYRVALALGDHAAAEDAARTTLALSDPFVYPRDYALDLVTLADVLAWRRKIDESAAVAKRAAVAAADLESGRVTRGLRNVAKRLEPHRDNEDVGAFLALI